MNNLLMQEVLFSSLRDAAKDPRMNLTAAQWQNRYDAFSAHVVQHADEECTPHLMRTLDQARIETDTLLGVFCSQQEPNPLAVLYCRKAHETLRSEMRILTLRLSHPGFKEVKCKPPVQTLYLNEGYHATDLVEIITPLFEMGMLKSESGRKAQLQAIVKIFEWAFNIPMPNYDVLRGAAINRKIHLTPLLDKMKEVLLRLSQQ